MNKWWSLVNPGGSLFLFDRKVLRYFRKDGHKWRKKKDGKTVKEAHERLKVSKNLSVVAIYDFFKNAFHASLYINITILVWISFSMAASGHRRQTLIWPLMSLFLGRINWQSYSCWYKYVLLSDKNYFADQMFALYFQAGGVDVLHCYYAHGEDNENFQRRSYWSLEEWVSRCCTASLVFLKCLYCS